MLTEWKQTKELLTDPKEAIESWSFYWSNGIYDYIPVECDISNFYTERYEAVGYQGYYAIWKNKNGYWCVFQESTSILMFDFYTSFDEAKRFVEMQDQTDPWVVI